MRIFLVVISVLYFLAVISALCINLNSGEYVADNLGLNGMGDYLAGFLSPLAFVWIAYGYLLQADQLKQNTKTSNNAERLSTQQFNYQKIKEQNDAQPTFFIDRNMNKEEDSTTYLNIFLKIQGPSIYDFKTIGNEAFQISKKIIHEGEDIHFHLRLKTEEIEKAKSHFKKVENNSKDLKNSKESDFKSSISTQAKQFLSKRITTVNFQYLDKLGLTQKNKLEIWYSKDGFNIDIGHNIKAQDDNNHGN